jgi:hypothetical protein
VIVARAPPPPQSLSRLHSTQVELLVSQTGVFPEHWAFEVQLPPPPVVHVFVARLQVPPLPQSRLLKHWTHTPRPLQSGVPEFVQSLATLHSTHLR